MRSRSGCAPLPEGAAGVALHHAAATLAARRGDADVGAALSRGDADEAGSGQSTARGVAALAEVALWDGDAEHAWGIVDEALAAVRDAEYACGTRPLCTRSGHGPAPTAPCTPAPRGPTARPSRSTPPRCGLLARLDDLLRDHDVPEPAAYRAQSRGGDHPPRRTRRIPPAWEEARGRWQQLGFPFEAAVCGWREAEAMLLVGADPRRLRSCWAMPPARPTRWAPGRWRPR